MKVWKARDGLFQVQRMGGVRDHQLRGETDWLPRKAVKKLIAGLVTAPEGGTSPGAS